MDTLKSCLAKIICEGIDENTQTETKFSKTNCMGVTSELFAHIHNEIPQKEEENV